MNPSNDVASAQVSDENEARSGGGKRRRAPRAEHDDEARKEKAVRLAKLELERYELDSKREELRVASELRNEEAKSASAARRELEQGETARKRELATLEHEAAKRALEERGAESRARRLREDAAALAASAEKLRAAKELLRALDFSEEETSRRAADLRARFAEELFAATGAPTTTTTSGPDVVQESESPRRDGDDD